MLYKKNVTSRTDLKIEGKLEEKGREGKRREEKRREEKRREEKRREEKRKEEKRKEEKRMWGWGVRNTILKNKKNVFLCFEGSQAMLPHPFRTGAFMMRTLFGSDERSSAGALMRVIGIYFDINVGRMHSGEVLI
jgi:hypothetical protein